MDHQMRKTNQKLFGNIGHKVISVYLKLLKYA